MHIVKRFHKIGKIKRKVDNSVVATSYHLVTLHLRNSPNHSQKFLVIETCT